MFSKFILLFTLLLTFTLIAGQHHHHHGHSHDDDDHHGHLHSHEHAHDHHHHHHGHHHDHAHESASFKYSREANERINQQQQQQHSDEVKSTIKNNNNKNENYNVWLSALSSTLMISIFPFFILFFIPLNNTSEHQSLLKVLLSFASGGLLGDAFLHLIPHALLAKQGEQAGGQHGHTHSHTHSHSHDGEGGHGHDHDMSVGLWVLAGILAFLIIEKVIRIVKGPGGHGHSHVLPVDVAAVTADADEKDVDNDQKVKPEKIKPEKNKSKSKNNEKQSEKEKENGDQFDVKNDQHMDNEKIKKRVRFDKDVIDKEDNKEKSQEIKVSGYLNLAADFTHNLTDGLAIGASFLAGKNIGYITAITILLHEIPHEIGDFAILIQSGCSKRKAMLLQLITAFGAFTGTFISLLAEGMGDAAQAWILPFTAGGFIYIATVSVIPELLEGTSLKQSIIEIIALIVGVFLMVLIAKYE